MRLFVRILVLAGCLSGLMSVAGAAEPELSARDAVDSYITALFVEIDAIKPLYASERDLYFSGVESALSGFVDFHEVARGVMAKYSTGSKGASPEQLKRFSEVFKASLVEFYGSALADYDGNEFELLPARGAPKNPERSTNVRMNLLGEGNSIEVQYTMFLNADRVWKLKNLYIEGVNLRRQYHSLFDDLMVKNNYDIDAVIDSWQLVE